MSRSRTRRTLLAIARTDRTFVFAEDVRGGVWIGKCFHCGRHLALTKSGEPLGEATVKHIEPRSHGGSDDPRNLAIACARCNHQKGRRDDARRQNDEARRAKVDALHKRRIARWRDSSEDSPPE